MTRGVVGKGLLLLLMLVLLPMSPVFADHDDDDDDDGGPEVERVDCARGKTLKKALEKSRRPLIVEFSGTCNEDVTIPGDDVTLRGKDATATIIGTVTLVGLSHIHLEDFTVRDTPIGPPATRVGDGVVVLSSQDIHITRVQVVNAGNISFDLEGSWVNLTDCTVTGSRQIGVAVALGSVVNNFGTLTVTGTTNNNAIVVTDKGQMQISPGSRIVTTDNAGSGLFVQLQGHIFAHGGSRLTSQRNASGINVVDEGTIVLGGARIEASDNLAFGIQVGQLADWAVVGGVTPNVFVTNNGGPGFLVSRQAFLRLRENTTITGNGGPGVVVDGAGVAIRGSNISGNNSGNGDVVLVFGTNATFDGGNTVPTPIFCDGTVLIRGQFTCGAPLTAAAAAAFGIGVTPETGDFVPLPQ